MEFWSVTQYVEKDCNAFLEDSLCHHTSNCHHMMPSRTTHHHLLLTQAEATGAQHSLLKEWDSSPRSLVFLPGWADCIKAPSLVFHFQINNPKWWLNKLLSNQSLYIWSKSQSWYWDVLIWESITPSASLPHPPGWYFTIIIIIVILILMASLCSVCVHMDPARL